MRLVMCLTLAFALISACDDDDDAPERPEASAHPELTAEEILDRADLAPDFDYARIEGVIDTEGVLDIGDVDQRHARVESRRGESGEISVTTLIVGDDAYIDWGGFLDLRYQGRYFFSLEDERSWEEYDSSFREGVAERATDPWNPIVHPDEAFVGADVTFLRLGR